MFEQFNFRLIAEDEIRNIFVTDIPVGYEFALKYPSYRGTFLSCIEALEVWVDDAPISPEQMEFCLNGKAFLPEELPELFREYWFHEEAATLRVYGKPLAPGSTHSVKVLLRHRIPYTGYFGNYAVDDALVEKTLTVAEDEPGEVPVVVQPKAEEDGKLKLSISLYSFTAPYTTGELDFEGVLKAAHDMGYTGIEIVAAQMVPDYPFPKKEWLERLVQLLQKYELHLVCWSAYIDMGIRSDRDLSRAEIIQYTRNDLFYAKQLGADLVRTQHAITPEIFAEMLPLCKQLGVKLTIEMHAPHHPRVPEWVEYLKIMKESDGFLGVVPDFSIFQTNERTPVPPAQVEELAPLLACSPYIHGKYYYLPEEGSDPAIPYDKIIPEVVKSGFSGYLTCEYEGHAFDGTHTEQLSRFVTLVRGLEAQV